MLELLQKAYERSRTRRAAWEPLWRDCYRHAMPQRGRDGLADTGIDRSGADDLFDSTAADATEQLAASLLAELMPPWSQWFGLRAGRAVPAELAGIVGEELDRTAELIRGHFDRSSFAVEMHQCLLDLATIGTATLQFHEAAAGQSSAFEFHAVPTSEMVLDGDHNGRILRQFRRSALNLAGLRRNFPDAVLPPELVDHGEREPEHRFAVVEAAVSEAPPGCTYHAWLADGDHASSGPWPLAEGRFERSPLLTFRWLKAAGEIYGRSPVMTALPDIKTANKVVELVLKNASLAVTGIWLADDDGVLNASNVRLEPGAIIPKAVGSAGLTPLQPPVRFDVSELILADLRSRIRHTLMVDRLGPATDARMTATEVLERGTETARLLGAAFGRLQAELITPLIERAVHILVRRGEIPPLRLDGREVEIECRSPLARAQARDDVRNVTLWLETIERLGDGARAVADHRATAIWLARTLGVPSELVRLDAPPASIAMILSGAE